jgi:ribosomal protein L9
MANLLSRILKLILVSSNFQTSIARRRFCKKLRMMKISKKYSRKFLLRKQLRKKPKKQPAIKARKSQEARRERRERKGRRVVIKRTSRMMNSDDLFIKPISLAI